MIITMAITGIMVIMVIMVTMGTTDGSEAYQISTLDL
jgi:hypothetical protein